MFPSGAGVKYQGYKNLNPLPLAVSPLSIDDKSRKSFEKILNKKNIGSEISIIVENNLRISGLFNPLSKDAFLQAPDIANLKPRFEDWNLIKAQALITGKVSYFDEKLRVEFRLWDVLAAKEMMALAFTTVPSNWRRVGHIISDKVYERLTGEKGYFDTRIIYVSEEGPKTQRTLPERIHGRPPQRRRRTLPSHANCMRHQRREPRKNHRASQQKDG